MLKRNLTEIVAKRVLNTIKESDDDESYAKNTIRLLMSQLDDQRELGKMLIEANGNLKDEVMALGDEMFGELSGLSGVHWMDFHSTTELNLSWKGGLKEVPNGVQHCYSLTQLKLSGNQITTIPDYIGRLTSLKILFLSKNQISTIPDSIGGLVSLEVFYIDKNKLSTLPDSLSQLSSLKQLNISENNFSVIPKCVDILEQKGCDVSI